MKTYSGIKEAVESKLRDVQAEIDARISLVEKEDLKAINWVEFLKYSEHLVRCCEERRILISILQEELMAVKITQIINDVIDEAMHERYMYRVDIEDATRVTVLKAQRELVKRFLMPLVGRK
jgi:hypothetical protein